MSFPDRFRRRREDEAERFARLSKTGRITEGSVLDINTDDQDRITHVFYTYNIAGVEYESSQQLSAEQTVRPASYAPGSVVVIRYDTRQPGNSIVM